MSSIVWRGSGKRTPTKATDCFSCSQRWGFCAWENAHQKGMLSTYGSFIGICYFMMSDEKDTEVLDTALLIFERCLRKIFGGSFLDLEKWLNIQMPLKKKSEEENITRQLSEAQKNQALSHIATADIITGLLLPQMKRNKSCFMLWSILLV